MQALCVTVSALVAAHHDFTEPPIRHFQHVLNLHTQQHASSVVPVDILRTCRYRVRQLCRQIDSHG